MRFFSPGLEDYFLVLRIKLYHIEILRINYDTNYFLFGTIRLLAFLFLFSYLKKIFFLDFSFRFCLNLFIGHTYIKLILKKDDSKHIH